MLKEFHFIVQPDKSAEKLIKIGRVSGLQLNKYLVFLKGRARQEFLENCNIMLQAAHDVSDLITDLDARLTKQEEAEIGPNDYFLQIGSNIDIAFLILCAHAMDLMFWDVEDDE